MQVSPHNGIVSSIYSLDYYKGQSEEGKGLLNLYGKMPNNSNNNKEVWAENANHELIECGKDEIG